MLHSKIIGDTGFPLLIIHGFLGMSDNWKTHATNFANQGFQVHLIDQRNHGRSFHAEAFSYEDMAADIYHYITHYNLEKVSILGHSMGGKIAMLFAVKYPQYIDKLIIADIAPKYYPLHHQHILEGLNALDFSQIKTRNQADQALANYIAEPGIRQFLLKSLYRKDKVNFAFRFNLPVLTKQIIAIGKPLPDATVFTRDTLFIRGEKSDYIQDTDLNLIQTHFPNYRLKTIPNAGHWLHAENPKLFFDYALAYLK